MRVFMPLLLLLAALALSGCAGTPAEDENSPALPALHVLGAALCNEKDEPVQLRGVSTHGIAWFPQYVNAGAFRSVKEAGGNVIRLAMYTEADDGYLYAPEKNLTLTLQGIEDALALDLYVIVDWHILADGDPNLHLAEAITFFDAVASRYPGEPGILYEICNEPNGVPWDGIRQYAYAISHVIRQYSPDAVLLLGVPDFSSRLEYPMTDPFPQENILYTYHYYAGEHQNYDSLKNAVEAGLPVFVTEWGIGEKAGAAGTGDTKAGEALTGSDAKAPALDEGKAFADYLNDHGISWCAWSLCNKEESYSLLRPDSWKAGRFGPEDLSETGSLIFKGLAGKGHG